MMLYEFTKRAGTTCSTPNVQRIGDKPGLANGEPPWYALNVKKRIGILKNDLQKIQKVKRSGTTKEYEGIVRPFYGKLRETWERLIEELLLNGVIHRFGRDIQTKRIKILTDIDDDDYKKIDKNMRKCSCHIQGHDEAPDLNEPLPDPEDIAADLHILEDYKIELTNKRNRRPR